MSIAVEICLDSVESALAANAGGADRIELCSALREGGMTPSAGMIHSVRAAVPMDLFVLIRPRAGDFQYSAMEFAVMRDDVQRARDLGADGVVIGLLHGDGFVDVERTAALVELARPMKVTFNRAFDLSPDLNRSLEDVVITGAERILTSGGQQYGMQGASKVAELVRAAGKRISILGGGGIRPSNVREFVEETGVVEVHTSLRLHATPAVQTATADALLGVEGNGPSHYVVRDEDVREMRRALAEVKTANRRISADH